MKISFNILIFILFASCSSQADKLEDTMKADLGEQEKWTRSWVFQDTVTFSERNASFINSVDVNTEGLHFYAKSLNAGEFFLLINQQLIGKSHRGIIDMAFDSLNLKGSDSISVLSSFGKGELFVGEYRLIEAREKQQIDILKQNHQKASVNHDLINALLVFALVILVLVRVNYAKRLILIMSPSKVFTLRLNEGDQVRIRLFDQDNIVFALVYVFFMASLLYIAREYFGRVFFDGSLSDVLHFLMLFVILAVLLVAKVILIYVMSYLFGGTRLSAYYFKELININLFIVFLLFTVSIFVYLNGSGFPDAWSGSLKLALVFAFVLRLIFLYFKILKLSNFSNVYLFSYFCTTEIFPFLIGLKYFI